MARRGRRRCPLRRQGEQERSCRFAAGDTQRRRRRRVGRHDHLQSVGCRTGTQSRRQGERPHCFGQRRDIQRGGRGQFGLGSRTGRSGRCRVGDRRRLYRRHADIRLRCQRERYAPRGESDDQGVRHVVVADVLHSPGRPVECIRTGREGDRRRTAGAGRRQDRTQRLCRRYGHQRPHDAQLSVGLSRRIHRQYDVRRRRYGRSVDRVRRCGRQYLRSQRRRGDPHVRSVDRPRYLYQRSENRRSDFVGRAERRSGQGCRTDRRGRHFATFAV